MDYKTIPSDEVIEKTIQALKQNGINAVVVSSALEAKAKALEMIPKGSEVMTMTSVTVDDIGLTAELNDSGNYNPVRAILYDKDADPKKKRQLGASADYVTGSVHAITEDGQVVIASNTGSQLPGYAYGGGKVVWVVGAQKIVANLDEAMKRIYDYVLPLESQRAHEAYGVEGSFVSKLLIINKEVSPERLTLILVKEQLGF